MKKLLIKNDTGNAIQTHVTDLESGADISAALRSVIISVDGSAIKATLEAVCVNMDLIAHLDSLKLHDEYSELEIDKGTHFVRFEEDEQRLKIKIFKK